MSDGTRAQMSFGRAPQEPFDQDNGITPKYGVNDNGQIVDLADGRVIENMDREVALQRELATKRKEALTLQAKRRKEAVRAAQSVIREDFKHLDDAPGSSRSMVAKDELIAAIVKGIEIVLASDDRLEDIEADGM